LIVFKYKSKKRYRHRRGHRQELTVLTIDDIVSDGKSLVTGETPKAKETPIVEVEEAPETTAEPVAEESDEQTDTGRRTRRRSSEAEPESSTEE